MLDNETYNSIFFALLNPNLPTSRKRELLEQAPDEDICSMMDMLADGIPARSHIGTVRVALDTAQDVLLNRPSHSIID